MEKFFNAKFIAVFSLIIGAGCLANDVFFPTQDLNEILIRGVFSPLNLDLIFDEYTLRVNGHNYVNAVFDVLLLLGGTIFIISRGREFRLVRFVTGIIFLANLVSLAYSTIYFIWNIKTSLGRGLMHFFQFIGIDITELIWLFLSYQLLKYFNDNRKLREETVTDDGITGSYFVKAFAGRRFWNLIVDAVVAVVIFSPFLRIFTYGNSFLGSHNFYPDQHLILVFYIPRAIYYLLSETILGITPAKLLTETRVLNYNGEKPTFKEVLIRTLVRWVPFEAFSFFTDNGWHDKWSETIVVSEEKLPVAEQEV